MKSNIAKTGLPPASWCPCEKRQHWGCGGHGCQISGFLAKSRGYGLRPGQVNEVKKGKQENPWMFPSSLPHLQKSSCCFNTIFLWSWERLRLIAKSENPNRVARRKVPVKQGLEGVVDIQVFKMANSVRIHEPNMGMHSLATELWYLYSTAFLIIISARQLQGLKRWLHLSTYQPLFIKNLSWIRSASTKTFTESQSLDILQMTL